jgi:uroporphyrinogen III methyltransferase/synthase
MSTTPTSNPATVYLVGAGPGDPGLVTLRAVECLQRADIVLYDYLVNPAVLEHAAPRAELLALGRPGTGRALSPDAITAQMVAHAAAGRTVVRLKGGDPSVFGRGADETTALRDAGVAFEIVPGVTTGLAVAAYCEIPITQQDDASAVALIAGRERDDKTESRVDYAALAAFPGTLVFYMGVGRAAEWSRALTEHGRSPVFVVGDVVDRAPDCSWFASRPLFGTRVLVPGSPATSRKLRERLSRLGADVILQPAIRITDPPDWAPVDRALERLADFDWLVFSSANGVDYLLRRLFERGSDARRLATVKLAAIGSGTADRLAEYHLNADLTPEEFVAESLARALLGEAAGRRFLLVRASRGREILADALTEAGATVEQVVAYGSVDVEQSSPDVRDALHANTIDWVAITSGSTATSLARLYGDALRGARFASIGPIASAALRELGYEPAVEADPHTTDGLIDAILRADGTSR